MAINTILILIIDSSHACLGFLGAHGGHNAVKGVQHPISNVVHLESVLHPILGVPHLSPRSMRIFFAGKGDLARARGDWSPQLSESL
jgi:hypothetical protein